LKKNHKSKGINWQGTRGKQKRVEVQEQGIVDVQQSRVQIHSPKKEQSLGKTVGRERGFQQRGGTGQKEVCFTSFLAKELQISTWAEGGFGGGNVRGKKFAVELSEEGKGMRPIKKIFYALDRTTVSIEQGKESTNRKATRGVFGADNGIRPGQEELQNIQGEVVPTSREGGRY